MMKRTLISGMWFVALWSLGGAMHVYLDVPRAWMLPPTMACAVAVWIGLARYDAWRATWHQHGMTNVSTVPEIGLIQLVGQSTD